MLKLDRRKFKRLLHEGEVARAQALVLPRELQEAQHAHQRLLHLVYAGSFLRHLSLQDLARFDRAALLRLGTHPDDLAAAIESEEDVADLRKRVDAALSVASQKAYLGTRLRDWARSNSTSITWA